MASWTSVQIATLVVEALTPITVAGLGVLFARTSRRIEQVQRARRWSTGGWTSSASSHPG